MHHQTFLPSANCITGSLVFLIPAVTAKCQKGQRQHEAKILWKIHNYNQTSRCFMEKMHRCKRATVKY